MMPMNTTTPSLNSPVKLRSIRNSSHQISGLFIFILIGAYAVFSLLLVLIGVQAYRNVVEDSDRNGQIRTTLSYVSNRIRSSDGHVSVERMGETNVLVIRQTYDEESYQTRIYYMPDGFDEQDDEDGRAEKPPVSENSGALYEQLVSPEEEFIPDMGERIVNVGKFDMTQNGDIIKLELTTLDGEQQSMELKLRAGGFTGSAGSAGSAE